MDFFLESPNDGITHMARDRELLSRAEDGHGAARLYKWDGAWVSLGISQTPAKDLRNPDQVRWVMRPTGGRAVLHGHDLTVGLAVPLTILAEDGESIIKLSRSVRTVYRRLIPPIIEALRASGVPALLGEQTRFCANKAVKSVDCFAHVSANDIVNEHTGQKVCGCALRVTEKAVLLQASIPMGLPLLDPSSLFEGQTSSAYIPFDQNCFASHLRTKLAETWT